MEPVHVVGERFELVRSLGRGGMGTVHLVRDRERGHELALKTVGSVSGDALLRFKHEFRVLREWDHPNFVLLHELIEHDGGWYISMEHVEGSDFATHVRRARMSSPCAVDPSPSGVALAETREAARASFAGAELVVRLGFDEARLRAALAELVRALSALHARGLVHRDLKAANVLIRDDGRLVVIDFGLVRGANGPGMSTDVGISGTIGYMAPEQASSGEIGPPADWYAVGVMLYEAMTGRLPFEGPLLRILSAKLLETPPCPTTWVDGLPPDLVSLTMDLLAIDPAARPSAEDIARRLNLVTLDRERAVRRSDRVSRERESEDEQLFVGRASLRAELAGIVASTDAGPRVVVVTGAADVGKSSLARRFVADVAHDHPSALVLFGRCHERELVPYKALDLIVDQLCRWLKRRSVPALEAIVPPDIGALATAFPVLRRIEAIDERTRMLAPDPRELRVRAASSLRTLLASIARTTRIVLVIDDFQHRDEDSRALLDEVLRGSDAPPLTLVLFERDGVDAGEALRRAADHRLGLDPFDVDDTAELFQAIHGRDAGIDREALAAIVRDARGRPFFVRRLVSTMFDADARGERTLDALLQSDLDASTEGERDVLGALALAGFPVPDTLVAEVTLTALPETSRHLRSLERRGLIRRDVLGAERVLEPAHDRIASLVVERMPRSHRLALHDRLARALEETSAPPERVARHWIALDQREHAVLAAIAAADHARDVLAFDRSERFYRVALEHLDPADSRARRLHLSRGQVLSNLGRGAEAAEAYRAALPAESPAEELEIRRKIADNLLCGGHFDAGMGELAKLLSRLGVAFPRHPIAVLLAIVWVRLRVMIRGYRFTEREVPNASSREILAIDACWAATKALGWIDPMRMQIFHSMGLLRALDAGDVHRAARSLALEKVLVAAESSVDSSRGVQMLALLHRLVSLAATPHAGAMADLGDAWVHFWSGAWAATQTTYARALRTFRGECREAIWEVAIASSGTLYATTFTGDVAYLESHAERLVEEARANGNIYWEASVRANSLGFLHLFRGDVAAARAATTHPFEIQSGGVPLENLLRACLEARIELYESRPDRAVKLLAPLHRLAFVTQLSRMPCVRILVADLEAQAWTATAARDRRLRREALRVCLRSLRTLRRAEGDWARACGLLVEASIELLDGTDAVRREKLEACAAAFDAAGMAAYRQAVLVASSRLDRTSGADARAWFTQRGAKDVDAVCRMLGVVD